MNHKHENINYIRLSSVGLASSIIASIIWFGAVILTGWEFGFVAILVGYLIGLGTLYGSKGKGGINIQIIAASLALFSMIFAEYLITNHYIYKYLSNDLGIEKLSYMMPISTVAYTMYEILQENLITLLFWLIGIYTAFNVCKIKNK